MTDHDTTTAKPESTWVWWCNEKSIAAGKVSVLAIVETFAAVGVWWWLAMHFNWSIFSFVALFAAPMLLLRSEESIAGGVELLNAFWTSKVAFSIRTFMLTFMGVFLFFSSIVLGIAMMLGILSGSMWQISLMIFLAFTANTSIFGRPQLRALEVLVISQLIRLSATLWYPMHGLRQLPHNWRETLSVIDLTHPPELIPQAGKVSDQLAVKSLWRCMCVEESLWKKITLIVLIAIIYLPALTYRWSLKASAWLWLPLILLPKQPLESLENVDKTRKIGRLVSGLSRFLPIVAALVVLWLTLSLIPEFSFLLNVLPENLGELGKGIGERIQPPQTGGVRYVALWLFCGLTLLYWRDADNYKTDKTSCADLTDKHDKARFKQDLEQLSSDIEKLHSFLIVTVLVWGEATVIYLLHTSGVRQFNRIDSIGYHFLP